jgi:hypothetical protein
VPFVLSIGIGFSKAVDAPQGFGMLTIMSVAPIISVLCTSLLRDPALALKAASIRTTRAALSYSLSMMPGRSSPMLLRAASGVTSVPSGLSGGSAHEAARA